MAHGDDNYRCEEEQQRNVVPICKDLSLRLENCHGEFRYTSEYCTSLHEAASNGRSKVLELLLQQGGDVNCRGNSDYTPLHLAVCSGHVDCVRVLLNYNADISITDEFGKTPIQTAELSSKHAVVKVLKSAGECRGISGM